MPDNVHTAVVTDRGSQKSRLNTKPTRGKGVPKPCDRCRAQHLKCVYTSDTCERCERSGHECIRTRKGIQFRRTSVSAFDKRHKSARRVPRSITASEPPYRQNPLFDVTTNGVAELGTHTANVSTNGHENDSRGDQCDLGGRIENSNGPQADKHSHLDLARYTFAIGSEASPAENESQRTRAPDPNGGSQFVSPALPYATFTTPLSKSTRMVSSDVFSVSSSLTTTKHRWVTRSSSDHFLNDLVKHPSRQDADSADLYVETVLLRYFHDELAPWFDLCDPDRHFATVVPQRAREPGPLRNALLTVSARSLARNRRFRSATGLVQWQGRLLPQLTEEFAVPYHNKCIRDLLQLSMQPRNLHDESLLAAVIALRTDEEFGISTREDEEDQQLFLRIASVFIDAQVPPSIVLPHSSPQVFLPASDTDLVAQPGNLYQESPSAHSIATDTESDLGASGLRQACFWTAFRQELHASFLRKQPVRFPLARCAAFRQLTPATDASWANRMVTFCADVLEFCYGSESSDGTVAPAYNNQERWTQLRDRENNLCLLLPATFEPIYCSEPNLAFGTTFPEIWYLEPCHVSGTTYIELARMLLGIFNPTRPQLGHGFIAATSAFISSTKKILFRLCGIALSNSHCPPSLINACIGISIFGEYFEEPDQQNALLEVLAIMANDHAYPTRQIANSLKKAWNRDEVALDHVDSPASTHHV